MSGASSTTTRATEPSPAGLTTLAEAVGFGELTRRTAQQADFHQPVLTATAT